MQTGLFYLSSQDRSIFTKERVILLLFRLILLLPCFIEVPVFHANMLDPDQTPRSAASDLGLHCLPMSFLRDTKHKWIKGSIFLKK